MSGHITGQPENAAKNPGSFVPPAGPAILLGAPSSRSAETLEERLRIIERMVLAWGDCVDE